ncbi:hypothetical protein HRbin17_00721 [bacterium HR17]|uniref:Alkyl hydroperoxide reductase subunit C/ Thiol specific antioxidant domain-containing protein n=1 Tax=Candidatus Fervidibacter japonicus TaxID=2035412 RepID=A0A2H5XAK5_9BACT|nr:hypothetical protein HRbin17_00721 [bacterium HR17]
MMWSVRRLCGWLVAGLMALGGAQVSVAVGGAPSPLKRGMELSYAGQAKLQVGEHSLTATVQMTDLVTEVKEGERTVVASLRVFAPQIEGQNIPPEAALRFLDITIAGEESATGFEQIRAEVPPFPFAMNFTHILPIYFVPSQRLARGKAWTARERVLIQPETDGEVQYAVKGKEKTEGSECFVVTRTLPKPLPVPGAQGAQIVKIADTLWVDAQTGIVRRLQREGALQIREGQILVTTLQLVLKSQKVLDELALTQRLKELEAIKAIQQKVGPSIFRQPSKEALDAVEQAINEFLQKFKDSPYRIHLETWQRVVQIVRKQVERQQQQGSLIGQPAPDFELPTVDRKSTVKLSALKGKVIVLNFFAHW